MERVYVSDVVDFYVESIDNRLYLHTDVKVWSKSALKHGILVIQELGQRLGELFTYSPTAAARKLAEIAGFRPTGCVVKVHYGLDVVEEFRLEAHAGEYDSLVALGSRAHGGLGEHGGGEAHETPEHNFQVGLLVRRVQAHMPQYAAYEYNRWAFQNNHVLVTIDGMDVSFNDTTVEVPKCL